MLFLADENVPRQITEPLRADGHTVTAVRDTTPQATDDVVLSACDPLEMRNGRATDRPGGSGRHNARI